MIFFFFNDTATTEIYTLSLHDALPISVLLEGVPGIVKQPASQGAFIGDTVNLSATAWGTGPLAYRWYFNEIGRSEEHTSELQSHSDLVCRLLLEKKKNT